MTFCHYWAAYMERESHGLPTGTPKKSLQRLSQTENFMKISKNLWKNTNFRINIDSHFYVKYSLLNEFCCTKYKLTFWPLTTTWRMMLKHWAQQCQCHSMLSKDGAILPSKIGHAFYSWSLKSNKINASGEQPIK